MPNGRLWREIQGPRGPPGPLPEKLLRYSANHPQGPYLSHPWEFGHGTLIFGLPTSKRFGHLEGTSFHDLLGVPAGRCCNFGHGCCTWGRGEEALCDVGQGTKSAQLFMLNPNFKVPSYGAQALVHHTPRQPLNQY